MSTFVPRDLECPDCGVTTRRQVAISLNPLRSLAAVAALELGRFQVWDCPSCGRRLEVDDPFLFTDLDGDLLVAQFPAEWEHEWPRYERLARAVWERNAGGGAPPIARSVFRDAMCRVVFGLDALREKVLIHAHGLDDAVIEALKLDLVRADIRCAFGPSFRPRVTAVRDDLLSFTIPLSVPTEDGTFPVDRVQVPLAAYHGLAAERPRWHSLLAEFSDALYVDLGRIYLRA
jgi:hypothetical protein